MAKQNKTKKRSQHWFQIQPDFMWNEWSELVVTLKCTVINVNSMTNDAGVRILHFSYVFCKRLFPVDLMGHNQRYHISYSSKTQ